jgi:signal transduction histidine kinase
VGDDGLNNRLAPDDNYPQLISFAVHELRSPASVVGGYLRMLQRDADQGLNERQRKMVDEAERSCARIVALLAELSDLAKLDAGTATLDKREGDVFGLVWQIAESVHDGDDRDVRLVAHGDSRGAPIAGDLARLRAAFHAIFRAIVREQDHACTVVADCRALARAQGREAVIVVAEDTLVPAALDAEPAVFDERRGGLGLALPIARRVIALHGGRLWSPAGSSGHGAALIALPIRGSGKE